MRNLEFAAMQKAEAEQKARLEERAKIWAEYLARYPDVVDCYARNPIKAQELADHWYKREQEEKRRIEKAARDLEKFKEGSRIIVIAERLKGEVRLKEERERRREKLAEILRNKESRAARESRYRTRDIQTTNKLTN